MGSSFRRLAESGAAMRIASAGPAAERRCVERWRPASTSASGETSVHVLHGTAAAGRSGGLLEEAGFVLVEQIYYHEPLELIAQETEVAILIVDLCVDDGEGLAMLGEASRRLTERPWVQIVALGEQDFHLAVKAMHEGATAFLESGADAAATGKLLDGLREKARDRRWRFDLAYEQAPRRKELGERLARLVRDLEALNGIVARPAREAPASLACDRIALIRLVRFIGEVRDTRNEIFGASLFADPCWDILLELGRSHLAGTTLSASSLGSSARTPLSTIVRKLDELEAQGLIERRPDPIDGRRKLVRLSDSGFGCLLQFLDKAAQAARAFTGSA